MDFILETVAAWDLKLGRCRQLMKSIRVCEYSKSLSIQFDLMLQGQASGERSQDQLLWFKYVGLFQFSQ